MGRWIKTCECGSPKDGRSSKCAKCANVGFLIDGGSRRSEQSLQQAIVNSRSYLQAANLLGVSRQTITRFVQQNSIDVSHFRRGRGRFYTAEQLLVKGTTRANTPVRSLLLRESLLPYRCKICNLAPKWQGKSLTLELDHENGDPTDNRIGNLRFLCPNCHAQQPTNKGANCRGTRKKRR